MDRPIGKAVIIGGVIVVFLFTIYYFSSANPEPIQDSTIVPEPIQNGTIVNGNAYYASVEGKVYHIENNTKRWYPNLTIYAKYGNPPATKIEYELLNLIPEGPPMP